MQLLPIRTETTIHRLPVVNLALLGANVLIFLVFDFSPTAAGTEFKKAHFVLDSEWPALYQLLTYQFAHADVWHLVGNMLFLWVFGNGVNAKLGDLPYLFFYLAGGVFAGVVFGWLSADALLGASGSIAAVTTAYLVLFPRSRVTVLFAFFFITFFEVPATIIIAVKIILWDNILAPQIAGGAGQVAYSAHLAGYSFGLVVAMLMLVVKAVPRDKFDMLALLKRWHQRRAFTSVMADPQARAQAQYGRVARVEPVDPAAPVVLDRQMDERSERRSQIAEHLRRREMGDALTCYEKLIGIDPQQCLPAEQQMAVAREYYATSRFPQAAAAFERYLASYKTSGEANEVRLLLGIISARDLKQYEAAEEYLREALRRSISPTRREQAQRWLDQIHEIQGRADAS